MLRAPLARLEGRIAIETVVARIKNVKVEGQPTRRPNPFFRGFEHLPITPDKILNALMNERSTASIEPSAKEGTQS